MKLRDLTFKYHTSIKEIAKEMGVSEMSIYQLSYVKYPSYEKIKKVAEIIGCGVDELESVIIKDREHTKDKRISNISTFKALLKEQGKTQHGLAKYLGVSPQRANQLLCQTYPSAKNIKKIAEFFEMSEQEIIKIYLKKD